MARSRWGAILVLLLSLVPLVSISTAYAHPGPEVAKYIDLGVDDSGEIQGFGMAQDLSSMGPGYICPVVADRPDSTTRVMPPGGASTVWIDSLTEGHDVVITFCVGDGAYQDIWQMYANYHTPCQLELTGSVQQQDHNGAQSIYSVVIPGYYVIDDVIGVTFKNVSTDDSQTSLWGLYVFQPEVT